jgi:ankyrin repeat protein
MLKRRLFCVLCLFKNMQHGTLRQSHRQPFMYDFLSHPLYRAALHNNVPELQRILATSPEPGAAATEIIGKGRQTTALHGAVCSNGVEVAEILLNYGAGVNVKNSLGRSSLHSSCERGMNWFELTKLFIEDHTRRHPDEIGFLDVGDNIGNTPLHLAVMTNAHVPRLLLSHGADVNATNEKGETPLHSIMHYSTSQRNLAITLETVALLLENGANVNHRTHTGYTALHIAACHQRVIFARNLIDLLLKHGADVNALTELGENALHKVAGKRSNTDISVLNRLFDAGIDITCDTIDGFNAMEIAERMGNLSTLKIINEVVTFRESSLAFALGNLRGAGADSIILGLDNEVVGMILRRLQEEHFTSRSTVDHIL